jgi:SAM-dependent methyltransferase
METAARLQSLMRERYQVNHLRTMTAQDFKGGIDRFLSLEDAASEGYIDPKVQRDLSIKFFWGHNHDFGSFQVPGRMGNRHIDLITTFIDQFRALPSDLTGAKILDVGCWTGGTSLLLCAMGAQVVALEEVKKYAAALQFLKDAFDVSALEVLPVSLFACNQAAFFDRFDYALFGGLLYHLTDPIVGTRIVYNALRDGGVCLCETMATPDDGRKIEYWGPNVFGEGSQEQLNRTGWNWFVPSPTILSRLLQDVGFADVVTGNYLPGRAFAVATRDRHRDINRAGLSVPSIR